MKSKVQEAEEACRPQLPAHQRGAVTRALSDHSSQNPGRAGKWGRFLLIADDCFEAKYLPTVWHPISSGPKGCKALCSC